MLPSLPLRFRRHPRRPPPASELATRHLRALPWQLGRPPCFIHSSIHSLRCQPVSHTMEVVVEQCVCRWQQPHSSAAGFGDRACVACVRAAYTYSSRFGSRAHCQRRLSRWYTWSRCATHSLPELAARSGCGSRWGQLGVAHLFFYFDAAFHCLHRAGSAPVATACVRAGPPCKVQPQPLPGLALAGPKQVALVSTMNFDLSQLDKKLKSGKAAPAKASKFAPRLLAKVSLTVNALQSGWYGS